jgi:phosphatidylglycerol:prolipoprotein diacylglycerol transferase
MPPHTLAWLHDLSPYIFQFGGGFGLRWYGVAYAAGFVVGWLLLRRLSRTGVTPLSVDRITDAMLTLCVGVVAGGRLGYVLFYEPSLLWTFGDSAPWWGLLQINRGGMASHGGMLGVLLACWFISRGRREANGVRSGVVPMLHVMDLTAFAAPPGLFFGRLANFINGELLGRIVAGPGEPAPWWAVRFPQEVFTKHAPALTPEQFESLAKLVDDFRVGQESDAAAFDRALSALQSGPAQRSAEVAAQLTPLISSRHPSQMYQAAAEGLVLFACLSLIWLRPRRPGVISAWFLLIYGVLRIATEFYRLPDAHLTVERILGLSRGQWLSAGMILAGAVLLAWCTTRRGATKFGPGQPAPRT